MNNAFYFILKAFFVLQIFNFYPDAFSDVGKWCDKKAKVSFKIYAFTNWKTNNYNTYMYCPISQCKDNQTMKFCQLIIEHNMRNIFSSKMM